MNRRVPARPDFSRWTALLLFGLAACIGIVVSACDQEPKGVVAVNADSAEAVMGTLEPTSEIEMTNRSFRPTSVGDNSDERNLDNQPSLRPIDGDTDSSVFSESPSILARIVAPLEFRVAVADVIVRAVFVSEGTDALRFRAIEYLKGTGPTEFEVKASTEGRNRKWDDREGVLILADGRNELAAIETGERVDDALYFVRFWTFSSYAGSLPDTYTIEGYRPAWLPATEAGVIRAASDNTVTYLTDDWNRPTVSYGTLSVPALRLIIAEWERMLEANRRSSVAELEDGPISVDDPVTADTCQFLQELYARRPMTFVKELSSGTAEGDGVLAFERLEALETTDQYHILALNESDAILFDAKIIDSDSSAENGFAYKLANARPLARGTYEFMESLIDS